MEAEGDRVPLHAAAKMHPIREKLHGLEQRLDPEKFLRIHRSTIVNLERIKEMCPQPHGEIVLILKNGDRFMMSRSDRHRVVEVFDVMAICAGCQKQNDRELPEGGFFEIGGDQDSTNRLGFG